MFGVMNHAERSVGDVAVFLSRIKEGLRKGSITRDDENVEKEYSSFLSAKEIILAYDSVTEIPGTLAEARITFVSSLFNMSDARFEQVAKTLHNFGDILSDKHRLTLKELINTKADNHTQAARAERIFLTTEERTRYYRKKYNDFIAERKKEIEMNNQRSQVQFLLLDFAESGMDECLNMSVAETSEVKLGRATSYLKDKYGIELQPLQFRNNLQSYGANLVNFYDVLNSARKSVADYYPPEYQKEFEVFYREQEERLFPDPRMARPIAAVKMVAAYQDSKLEPTHGDYLMMCKEIEACLADIPLEVCIAYIKKKDEPAETFFKEVLTTIYQIIKEYHDNTVSYAACHEKSAHTQDSLAITVNKNSYPTFPERPTGKNRLPLEQEEAAIVPAKKWTINPVQTFDASPSEKLTPVAKTPSFSDLEQKRKPLPPLPKSYSANDVAVTVAPAPILHSVPASPEQSSGHHRTNPSVNFFQKRQMVAAVLAKDAPPSIPGGRGMGNSHKK